MSRLLNHLPRLGALVLAVALAGIAYSIYHGQSNTTNGGESGARGAGLTTGFAMDNPKPKPAPKPTHSPKWAHTPQKPTGRVSPTIIPVTDGPVAPVVPVGAPQSDPAPDQGRGLPREPRRPSTAPRGRAPKPAPRRPTDGQPVTPRPKPTAPNVGTPGGSPPVQPPGGGAGGSPVTNPPVTNPPVTNPPATAPVTAPADPEAGLDDTPVGGLDQTDLGEPVDETGAAPAAPTG